MKIIATLIFLFTGTMANGYAMDSNFLVTADTMVRITGKVLNTDDTTAVKAVITYQKLPYYDDMGMISAKENTGAYEMYMQNNIRYMVQVKADGFDVYEEEFLVKLGMGSETIEKHFYVKPDEDHQKIVLDDLQFASGKATIGSSSFKELDDLANWLDARPGKSIQLEGHTDFAGSASANLQLSEDRVTAVKAYLVKKGVSKKRIRTKAFGGTQPLTKERSPAGRASNRRVEVRVLN